MGGRPVHARAELARRRARGSAGSPRAASRPSLPQSAANARPREQERDRDRQAVAEPSPPEGRRWGPPCRAPPRPADRVRECQVHRAHVSVRQPDRGDERPPARLATSPSSPEPSRRESLTREYTRRLWSWFGWLWRGSAGRNGLAEVRWCGAALRWSRWSVAVGGTCLRYCRS